MQVADLKTGRIVAAELPEHPQASPGLMHGIGWTPDQNEVWRSGKRHILVDTLGLLLNVVVNSRRRSGSRRGAAGSRPAHALPLPSAAARSW
jgi:hypothetical protein